jgi:hypothetical protein
MQVRRAVPKYALEQQVRGRCQGYGGTRVRIKLG